MPSLGIRTLVPRLSALALLAATPALFAATPYAITNLVSDIPGVGTFTDANLVNAWGLAAPPTGPWWVNGNGTGVSLVYDGTGSAGTTPLIVAVQPPSGASPPSSPTGIVFNPTTDFSVTPGNPAIFIFATEGGTINAWNPNVLPLHAVAKVDNSSSGAIYKGLTLGSLHNSNVIYAANFHAATIEVYNTNFVSVALPTSAFIDPMVPAGYAPFNVQNIGGLIYVAYAKQDDLAEDDVPGPGFGYVTIYKPDGTLVRRLQHGSWMNAPWAMVQASATFGDLSGKILLGNFGSGSISAFDPNTGALTNIMRNSSGTAVVIRGLWGLGFGNDGPAGSSSTLYFAAGIRQENHGLFGTLTVVPPPPGYSK